MWGGGGEWVGSIAFDQQPRVEVRGDMIDFTVDRSPHKQGLLLPGTRIPIRHPDAILEARPDYLFILPWNLRDEIVEQMQAIRGWGGQFVVPIPRIEVF